MGGGKGLGGRAVLFGQSAGIFTSCQQEVRVRRAGAAFPAGAHTSRRLSICLQFFGSVTTKLHACQEEGKPQSTPPGGGSPPALGSGSCLPRLASLCLDSTCWRQWPRKDRSTHSLAGKSANTGAARHGGEVGSPRTWPCGHKQVSPEPRARSDPPRRSDCQGGWKTEVSFLCPLLNSIWSRENPTCAHQPVLPTVCKNNTLFLCRLARDKGRSEQDEIYRLMAE